MFANRFQGLLHADETSPRCCRDRDCRDFRRVRNPMLQDTIIDREYLVRHPPNEEHVLSANTSKPTTDGRGSKVLLPNDRRGRVLP